MKFIEKNLKVIAAIAGAVIIGIAVLCIIRGSQSEKREIISVCSSLIKAEKDSSLKVLKTPYNGVSVSEDTDEKGNKSVRFCVAYNGYTTVGFDFSKIDIQVDKGEKKVMITLPEMFVQGEISNEEKPMEFIRVRRDVAKSNNYMQEAFELCKRDLEEETKGNTTLVELAKENATKSVQALLGQAIEAGFPGYTVQVQ